jgi:hypothetical protein
MKMMGPSYSILPKLRYVTGTPGRYLCMPKNTRIRLAIEFSLSGTRKGATAFEGFQVDLTRRI